MKLSKKALKKIIIEELEKTLLQMEARDPRYWTPSKFGRPEKGRIRAETFREDIINAWLAGNSPYDFFMKRDEEQDGNVPDENNIKDWTKYLKGINPNALFISAKESNYVLERGAKVKDVGEGDLLKITPADQNFKGFL